MLKTDEIAPIDTFFAERLLARYADATAEEKTILALLMSAARQGHLCLPLENALPSLTAKNPKELHFNNQRLYLQKNWQIESRFLQHIRRLQGAAVAITPRLEGLTAQQAEAARIVLGAQVALLAGGPGTGKTYTAAKIVESFLSAGKRVVVTAPTGKAAAHLEAGLRRHVGATPAVKCGTLHAVLDIKPNTNLFLENAFLPADMVIVDECSMIDANLFCYFLAALARGTRLILMGDPDQLPPVDAGSLFADLVEAAKAGYPLPCALLSQCMRSENKTLLQLANAVRSGQSEVALPLVRQLRSANIDLWEKVSAVFPLPTDVAPDAAALLQQMGHFRILSCMRRGPQGADAINQMLVERYRQKTRASGWWAAPILIKRNDYDLALYNGDSGILVHRAGKAEYALFAMERTVPAAALPPFEYSYCLSVHKSQGSEYRDVLLLIPPGSEVFGREVLYTAITRARQNLIIDGDEAEIYRAIQRSSRKISGLCERLLSMQGV